MPFISFSSAFIRDIPQHSTNEEVEYENSRSYHMRISDLGSDLESESSEIVGHGSSYGSSQ